MKKTTNFGRAQPLVESFNVCTGIEKGSILAIEETGFVAQKMLVVVQRSFASRTERPQGQVLTAGLANGAHDEASFPIAEVRSLRFVDMDEAGLILARYILISPVCFLLIALLFEMPQRFEDRLAPALGIVIEYQKGAVSEGMIHLDYVADRRNFSE